MTIRNLRLLACLLEIRGPCRIQHAASLTFSSRHLTSIPSTRSFHTTERVQSPPQLLQEQFDTERIAGYLHLLPRTCPGCGAHTHDDPQNKAGFFGRRAIRKNAARFLNQRPTTSDVEIPGESPEGPELRNAAEGDLSKSVCDRCHDLAKESLGIPIVHPNMSSIAAIIDDSPFQQNHVYHVIDAADFPASVIPRIFDELDLVQQRSQNRRAKSTMYKGGRRTTVSFIVTRSDVLFPSKDQVDHMMPWFVQTLRAALGRNNENARMGNVHLVSAKRGWWTTEIKEDILRRGGGNWMVGKVNVGKSNLFEVLYPKGSKDAEPDFARLRAEANLTSIEQDDDHSSLLLPPSQPLVSYPTLPLVSSLPGTTASPIRLPFRASNGQRAELIDLPGLFRSPLEAYVKRDEHVSLVMTKRPMPDQVSLRPHQSLLIGGGLVRISPYHPTDNDDPFAKPNPSASRELVLLAHPFLPTKVPVHVTSTIKAESIQKQTVESGISSLLMPDVGSQMKSSGVFTLNKDVTRAHAAKLLLRYGDKRRKVEDLPFKVFATDIVIEGIGWVELTAQVRLANGPAKETTISDDVTTALRSFDGFEMPKVEVFTPGGKGVMARETMGAWTAIKQHPRQKEKDMNIRRASGNRRRIIGG